jgi:leader peptidase (prepilin peptidase) / N-methyltransferase
MLRMESFVLIITAILGALIGSFTNVLIYRIPIQKSIAFPPSACPNCSHRLGVLDLVPILSWAALGGKCRYCRNPISSRYPLIEAVSAIGYFAIAWKIGLLENPVLVLGLWFMFTCFLAGSAIDFATLELPDALTIPVIGIGLIVGLLTNTFAASFEGTLIGAGLISSIIAFGSWVLRRFKEPRHPDYPIGFANIHLAMLVGAWFGIIAGLIAGLILVTANLMAKKVLPMPDFITLGGVLLSFIIQASSGTLLTSVSNALQAAGAMALVAGLYWWVLELRNVPDTSPEIPEEELDPIAMGFGDVKLWAAAGVFIGWSGALFGLGVAVALGAVIGIIHKIRGGESVIPFGPWLALGALIAFFTDSAPLLEYLKAMGF